MNNPSYRNRSVPHFALAAGALSIIAPLAAGQAVTQDAILTASDAAERSFLGSDIFVSGDLAIVAASGLGAPNISTEGRVYLFDLATETELSSLPIPQQVPDKPRQIMGVAIAGNAALVGTRRWDFVPDVIDDEVYVFDISDPASPTLVAEIFPAEQPFEMDFGVNIDAQGTLAVIGAPFDSERGNGAGAAYIYDFADPANPVRRGKLLGNDTAPVHFFGEDVAMDNGMAIVGAPREDTNASDAGAAYLFDISDPDNPAQLAKLLPPTGDTNDFFGDSVAISGDLAIVSAFFDDDMGLDAGAVYVFDISVPTAPALASKIVNPSGSSGDRFGWRLALEGTTAVISEVIGDAAEPSAGAAFVYDLSDPSNPVRTDTLVASDAEFLDFLGDAVAIAGNAVLLGAELRNDPVPFKGAVYVYRDVLAGPCPGDATGDGGVGTADLLVLLANWGQTTAGGAQQGDFDESGSVGTADLLILLANWASVCN
jgi:hypothetical protein